jgi:hypothetical protein
MRSSRSIQLVFLGSALALLGCGGDQHANAKRPCPPRPDGTPDPNCAGNNNRTHVRTGGVVFIPGMGGSSSSSGTKSGVTTSTSGVRSGGFGRSGGSSATASS